MYFITSLIFSPLNPTKQKIRIGKIIVTEHEIINCKELKMELKIKKIKIHQITQKIAIGYSIIPKSLGLKL